MASMRTRTLLLASLLITSAEASAAEPGRPSPVLKTASTHPMQYYVSLPLDHSPSRSWPVVVVIPDAKREFRENLNAFAAAGSRSRFIFVAPLVLTCGGPYRGNPPYPYSAEAWKRVDSEGAFAFDEAGIAAVVADVHRELGGEERYFLTGWEAGGHTVWAMLFRHPDALRAVAPVTTNYLGRWLAEKDFSSAPARATLPVTVLFVGPQKGDLETARGYLMKQSRDAVELARKHGYENVSFEVVSDRPHGPLAEDVLKRFAAVSATP